MKQKDTVNLIKIICSVAPFSTLHMKIDVHMEYRERNNWT